MIFSHTKAPLLDRIASEITYEPDGKHVRHGDAADKTDEVVFRLTMAGVKHQRGRLPTGHPCIVTQAGTLCVFGGVEFSDRTEGAVVGLVDDACHRFILDAIGRDAFT